MLRFYLDRSKDSKDIKDIHRNEFVAHFTGDIRHYAILATEQGCVLKYATNETEEPVVLTRENFFTLFNKKKIH